MSGSNYKPPTHREIHVWNHPSGVNYLVVGCQAQMTPDEAIKLGLALMENGLHQKELAKIAADELRASQAQQARRNDAETDIDLRKEADAEKDAAGDEKGLMHE